MIALAPFHVTTPRKIELKLPAPVAQDLDLYRRLYQDTYGAEVAESDVVREIIRAFLDHDDAFRRYKEVARSKPMSRRGHAKDAVVPKAVLSGGDASPQSSG